MGRYFTHYWSNETWEKNREFERELFEYTAGNQFGEKEVDRGDTIYAVTISKGDLYIAGKMVVGRRDYSAAPVDDWKEHLFASSGTPMSFDKKVPGSVVKNLRVLRADGSKRLKFFSPGKLDRQALRGVAELDARSASRLDRLLPSLSSIGVEERAEDSKKRGKKGGGFGSQEINRKVERAAIRFVTRWYKSRGWRVQSVEAENKGYDLCCIKGDTQEHVEVKGVRGEAPSFPITVGEIGYARKNASSKIIVVVSALSKKRRLLSYDWAEFNKAFELKPLAFRASLR